MPMHPAAPKGLHDLVTGPVVARQGVRVEVYEQGRPRGVPMSQAMSDAMPNAVPDAMPTDPASDGAKTTISLSTEAFTRRAAGRRSVSDTAYDMVGDEAIALRVMEALVVAP